MNKSNTEIDNYLFNLIRKIRELNYNLKINFHIKENSITIISRGKNLLKDNIQCFIIKISFKKSTYLIKFLELDDRSDENDHKNRVYKVEVKGIIDIDDLIKDILKLISKSDNDIFYPHYPF